MKNIKRDKQILKFSYDFLLNKMIQSGKFNNAEEILDIHLNGIYIGNLTELNHIFFRLIKISVSNEIWACFIKKNFGKIKNIGEILFHFDPHKIYYMYPNEDFIDDMINDLDKLFDIKLKYNITIHSLIYKLCRTIISGAKYFAAFKTFDEFKEHVNKFCNNENTKISLPINISNNIYNIGFTTASELLKDIGFRQYVIPDSSAIEILHKLKLSDNNTLETAISSMQRIATNNIVSLFYVEKMFRLISTGYFHENIINIKSHKEEFIISCNERFNSYML
jgi:hypothetical protein